MEQYGTVEIVNHNNGMRAVLHFKPAGSIHKDLHRVEGSLQDKEYVFGLFYFKIVLFISFFI